MPRKFKSPDRYIEGDPKYQHALCAKFINCVMREGKKELAQRIFYDALAEVKRRLKES